ncbi:DUF4145 domain-containing protein [Streptomyces sp. NPDC046939]|uniref:DUF4145 domain-containing protein n=1 Tax=Streptomyces sp. NPDC046939 TaxID=3155376 RepID=UPI0033ED3C13
MGNEGEPLRLYKKALGYAQRDPEVFLSTARRAAEAILMDVAVRQAIGSKPTLEALLTVLGTSAVVPPKVVLAVRTIQNYGNFGSHAHGADGGEISAEDIQPCLQALTQLASWYAKETASQADDASRNWLAATPRSRCTTRLADSTLIVVKAVLLGSGFDLLVERRGHRVSHLQLPWSDSLVTSVAERILDVAVYNEQRVLRMAEHDEAVRSHVVTVGRVGYSMGGHHFYLLAARAGRWGGVTAEEFLADPSGAQIAVPRQSDMFGNILSALSTDEAGLRDLGVQIVDVPHHLGLELFQLNPDILAVGGQNLRMHARDDDRYFELLDSTALPPAAQRQLRAAASNVLIANKSWLREVEMDADELHHDLMRTFHGLASDTDRFEALVRDLVAHASFPIDNTPESRERLVRHVLFESYRLGEP